MATIDTEIEVSVKDFNSSMDAIERKEMFTLLNKEFKVSDLVESEYKEAFYKELAYQIGNSDSEILEFFINELQYWSR